MNGQTLDLRTGGFRARERVLRFASGPIAAVIVAAILTALTVAWLALRNDAAELESQAAAEVTSAEQLREALQNVSAAEGGTAPALRSANIARTQALDAAAPAELDVFTILTALRGIATADATIQHVEVDAGNASLVLEGQAASGDAAADYLERLLADLLWVEDAYIVRTAPAGNAGALEFRIEATVNSLVHAPAPSFEATLESSPITSETSETSGGASDE